MKKIYLILLLAFFTVYGNAQIAVTVTNPTNTTPNLAASYPSLALALTDINLVTAMTGPVTLTCTTGGTETAPPTGLTIGSASLNAVLSATNTVTINKSGGTVTLNAGVGTAIPTSAAPDGILKIAGADYITIDGLTFTDGNVTNPATMEFGIALFKASLSDGASNNTIQNCRINMQRINNASGTAPMIEGAVGILMINSTATAAITGLTPTTAAGTNSNNKFYSNTINGGNYGIGLIGFAGVTPFTTCDTNNDIGGVSLSTGNSILNFGGAVAATNPAAAIRTLAQYGLNVSYNTVNNNNGSGVNHVSTLRGIYLNTATSASATIGNNIVTINSGGTTSQLSMIENVSGSTAAGNTINISNNTITGGYATATTGVCYGIYNQGTPATVNITSNTISNISYSTAANAGSGVLYPIYNSGAATTVNVTSNTVNNISRTGTTGATTIGIYVSAGTNQNVNSNSIYNLSIDGAGTASTMYGIQTTTSTVVCNNNIIHDLTCIKTSGTSALYGIYNVASPTNETYNNNQVYSITNNGTGTTYGLYTNTTTGTRTVSGNTIYSITAAGTTVAGMTMTTSSPTVFNNKIYNIQSTSSGSPLVSGIIVSSVGTAGTANLYNNLIGNITAPNANSTTDAVRGINITVATASSTVYLSFNTINLSGTSSGTDFSSSGIFHTYSLTSTTANLVMRNNIIVNNCVAKGAGKASAFRRSAATDLNNYSTTSNNNLFYGSTLFYDGTNNDVTLSALKARLTPGESASVTENPNFVSTTGSDPTYLHINTGIATQIESGGIPVSTPVSITTDFDNETRNVSTPDIGADEFVGVPAVLMVYSSSTTEQLTGYAYAGNTNQAIIRVKVVTTGSASPLSLTNLTLNANGTTAIGDINATTAKVYYTGASTTFSTGTLFGATTPTIADFLVTGSQALSEGDNYFWLAYDVIAGATHGNLIDGGCVDLTVGGNTYTPTISAPAGSKIIVGPMSGNYNVGVGQSFPDFVTLTAAITDLNARGVSGAVTFTLTNSSATPYNTANGESFPLTINQVTGASAVNTISIFPNTGMSPVITGSSTAIFKLNGADYVTINGSNNAGTDKNLTISNTNTATSTVAIWISSLGAGLGATDNTVKNCIIETGTIALTTYAVYIAGTTISTTGTGADNHNTTIQNNTIRKATYGIFVRGVATTGELTGLNITQNAIGSNNAAEYITDYGMQVYSVVSPGIIRNEIFNIISDNTKYGIYFGTNISDAVISRNNIHGLGYTNTTNYITYGIYFSSATGCTNNQMDNNAIYDLRSYGTSTSTSGAAGIRIVGGDGYKIYFNTVSLTDAIGTTTASVYSFGLMVSTASTNMDIRNNIFYNARSGGITPRNYSIYTITGTTFTNVNYNSYYSTGAALGFVIAEVADLAALRIATAGDANSIGTDPLLNSATNVQPGIGSPALGAGDNSTGITIDITGVTRNNPPTIGAYEIAADAAGPVITYTMLENTLCNTARTLAATITDAGGGVNTTVGTRPRLYFKKSTNANTFNDNTNATDGWKYTEATNAANPFSFTTDYSLVNGGVAAGNIIQYFVVAQDLAAIPNVGINSGIFAVTPSSVALTSAAFPITGSINQYTWIAGGLSSDVTIGAAGTYPTLTGVGGLFEAINATGLTNNITASILDAAITETGTVSLNAITYGCAGSYTLLVKPAAGVTTVISGTVATTSMINLNGADNVTFDGSNNGTSSKDMTFRNSSTTGAVIRFINDATFNTVKNSILEGGVTSTTSGVVAFSTSTGTLGNSNNTIMNNDIRDKTDVVAAFANTIYSGGTAVAPNASNTISGNNLFNFNSNGINMSSTGIGNSWQITGNNIYNAQVTPSAVTQNGILVGGGTGHSISNNNIGGNATGAAGTWTNTGNVILQGIAITGGSATISGNTVANITGTNTGTTGKIRGIAITADVSGSIISTNNVHDLLTSGSGTGLPGGSIVAMGIYYFPAGYQTLTVTDNTIFNISIENTAALTVSNVAAGIVVTNNAGVVSGNKISGIKNKTTGITVGQPPIAAGLYTRFSQNAVVSNNMISIGFGETTNTQFNGVMNTGAAGDQHFYYYNSVYIGGTTAGSFSSFGFLRGDNSTTSVGHPLTIKNNIFFMNRTGGSSVNYAIGNQGTAASTGWVSDYNDLYNVVPANIGFWNATGYDFDNWKTTSAGDASSLSILPEFVSSTDLHLTANNAAIDNKGIVIAGITTDIDGQTRGTGVVPSPDAPDMGADEFAAGPVPVTLVYFKGSKQNNGHLLDWKVTCYNSPTVTMQLERSADGRKFTSINNQTETALRCLQPFSFVDAAPLSGINYYRLKSIDIDGKETYSNIVALLNKEKGFEIVSLVPNPVKDNAVLSVTSAVKSSIEIVITDLSGKQLNKQRVTMIAGNNQLPLNVRNLPAGIYQVTGITADGMMRTLRFVKQ